MPYILSPLLYIRGKITSSQQIILSVDGNVAAGCLTATAKKQACRQFL